MTVGYSGMNWDLMLQYASRRHGIIEAYCILDY